MPVLASILALALASAPPPADDARAADEAYRAGRWREAIEAYRRVRAAAPGSPLVAYRLCTAHAELGRRNAALPFCREAVSLESSALHRLALARVLSMRGGDGRADLREAASLARAAVSLGTFDAEGAAMGCEVALRIEDRDLLQRCADRLVALAPAAPETKACLTLGAVVRGDVAEAHRRLEEAHAAGLPPAGLEALGDAVDELDPPLVHWATRAAWIAAAWCAVLLVLLAAGAILSAVTLRAAARLVRAPADVGLAAARGLRRAYAAVLWATCLHAYASVPLLLAALAGGGDATLVRVLAAGGAPLEVLLVGAVPLAVTSWALARGLWAGVFPPRLPDPGQRVGTDEHPRLAALLREVAARIGTRPVDAVLLTPRAEVAVLELGSSVARLRGRAERCLVLGIGVLEGMSQGELRAVLAHEYGHFVNRDRAGGGLALAVRRSATELSRALVEKGASGWLNPAWSFGRAFYLMFLRISQGASRLREILADRGAALACGGPALARGMEHFVSRAVRLRAHARRSLAEVIEARRALPNLYRYAPARPVPEEELLSEIAAELDAEPSPYDSHPRWRDRIAWVSGVAAADGASPDDDAPAWALLDGREQVERAMTDRVRAEIAADLGIAIPAEPAEAVG